MNARQVKISNAQTTGRVRKPMRPVFTLTGWGWHWDEATRLTLAKRCSVPGITWPPGDCS